MSSNYISTRQRKFSLMFERYSSLSVFVWYTVLKASAFANLKVKFVGFMLDPPNLNPSQALPPLRRCDPTLFRLAVCLKCNG